MDNQFKALFEALKEFSEFQRTPNILAYPHLESLPHPTLHHAHDRKMGHARIVLQFNGFAIHLNEDSTYWWEDTSGG